jgi:hypothetical protein
VVAGWLKVNQISQAFLSKGLVILSLTAFLLANFPSAISLLGSSGAGWKLPTLFIGSLLFLMGYIIASVSAPPELSGHSVATQIVSEMLTLDTWFFFRGRTEMLRNLIKDFSLRSPFDLPKGYIDFAKNALDQADKGLADQTTYNSFSRDIYHADIQLRQFVKPSARYSALTFLAVGMGLMLVPTSINVFSTLRNLL